MKIPKYISNIKKYLEKDTWDSWLVSLFLVIIFIKFIFFPILSVLTGAPLPMVVIESCSMYHESSFEEWWTKNSVSYEQYNITKEDFERYPHKNGLNKGDILLVWGHSKPKMGDVIIFEAKTKNPIIHRTISLNPIATKGDNNKEQLEFEKEINETALLGKAVIRVPFLGWIKLIFFEPLRPENERGFCS